MSAESDYQRDWLKDDEPGRDDEDRAVEHLERRREIHNERVNERDER